MDSAELFKVFGFGGSVAFHVPLQVSFAAETACAVRAFMEAIDVGFGAVFFFHVLSFLGLLLTGSIS